MFVIIGGVIVLGCVMAGFMMAGGHIGASFILRNLSRSAAPRGAR